MKIEEVRIHSPDIKGQEAFYSGVLNFQCSINSEGDLVVESGYNKLIFEEHLDADYCYHYCFLIPTGSLEAALHYLTEKKIELLPHQDSNIIHFDNGRSCYFFDADGNIAEFIERPLLHYSPKKTFDIADVIALNEIGMPVQEPLKTAERLQSEFGIVPLNSEGFDNEFCWVGNHEGVILVPRAGRNWLPTTIASEENPISVDYSVNEKRHSLVYSNNNLKMNPRSEQK